MRVLIVGAGVGGMTLAALLERRGARPVLVERAPNFEHAGYMLSLYSLGSRVLHGLKLYRRFAEASFEATHYVAHNDRGEPIKRWSMAPIAQRVGPLLSSTRPDLVGVLHEGLHHVAVRFDTALVGLEQAADEVRAAFSDGSTGVFDLVVGADGMHSRVRGLTFSEPSWFHTGWGGWVWWAGQDLLPADTFMEYWGAGRFLGAYPTPRGAGVFASAPLREEFDQPGPGRRARLRRRFAGLGPRASALLDALPDDEAEMYFWRLSDVRSADWVRGRVVLLGDAAGGFLPTAGIGASMAMESAAVLNDELSRADNRFLEQALQLYVKRRRRRVERLQEESRRLARWMFVSSRLGSKVRNVALRFYSLEMFAKSIAQAFDEPI